MTRDMFKEFDMHNVCLQLIGSRSTDGRQQNMPTCFEASTIIVGDFSSENIHHLCYNMYKNFKYHFT